MDAYLNDIRRMYRNYRKLAESAIAQIDDEQLRATLDTEDNSIAIVMQHVAGNLRSRFRDFLTQTSVRFRWTPSNRQAIVPRR